MTCDHPSLRVANCDIYDSLSSVGRGSSYLSLARLSLLENFDGRAVDYASRALRDLTRYQASLICVQQNSVML